MGLGHLSMPHHHKRKAKHLMGKLKRYGDGEFIVVKHIFARGEIIVSHKSQINK